MSTPEADGGAERDLRLDHVVGEPEPVEERLDEHAVGHQEDQRSTRSDPSRSSGACWAGRPRSRGRDAASRRRSQQGSRRG